MRTLLTGFGAFGRVVNNPSARIVEHYARAGAAGHDLTTRVLPVSYARAGGEIRELLANGRFDAALLLGVAGRETHLRLEQWGCRRAGQNPDCDGQIAVHTGRRTASLERYPATVAPEPLLNELGEAGFLTRLSDDAGHYVCNHTYYTALETIAGQGLATRCLFLHVPADADTFAEPVDGPAMPLVRQVEAVSLILDWLARQAAPRD